MQALEKITINNDWITIIMVMLFVCVFFLKGIDAKKLKGFTFALFNKGFVEEESESRIGVLHSFHILIFLFSITVLSLIGYHILRDYSVQKAASISQFGFIFLSTFLYFVLKWVLEYLFSLVFLIKNEIRYFLISKSSYLYNICFYLFIALVLVQYSKLNNTFLIAVTSLFFLVRFIFHSINNKNLILSKLFYFILYLCAFEIAPLFILFKLMF